ncbi:MAG: hypothetical protein KDA64_04295 [Rhodospirillaceae bacterium]|nr:hypothetical protein [Rhodospirillaceae bacterium]
MRCATRFAALVVVLPLALLVAVVAQAQSPLPSAWCGDHPASCAPMQAASGMIDEIVSQSTRQDLLIDFAGGLAVLGLADEARAVLAGVAPEMGRYTRQFDAAHWIAITLAEAYSKAGQAEAAVAVLEAALAAAEANPNGDPYRLYDIALEFARADAWDRAEATALAVAGDERRQSALIDVAIAMADAGLDEDASRVIDAALAIGPMPGDGQRAGWANLNAVAALTALERWDDALAVADQRANPMGPTLGRLAIARAQGEAGQAQAALATIDAVDAPIHDPAEIPAFLAEQPGGGPNWYVVQALAYAEAAAGLSAEALATVAQFDQTDWEEGTLETVAEIHVAAGRGEDAVAAARANRDGRDRVIALTHVIERLADAGETALADETLATLLEAYGALADAVDRGIASQYVAQAHAALGQWDEAEAAVAAAPDWRSLAGAQRNLAILQAQHGLLEAAAATLAAMGDSPSIDNDRDRARAALIRGLIVAAVAAMPAE